MKLLSKFLVFTLFMFFSVLTVSASNEGYITARGGLTIRTGPGTNYARIDTMPSGTRFTINSEQPSGNGCADVWYNINFYGGVGYICSTHAKKYEFYDETTSEETESEEFESQAFLEELHKFPESYKKYIITLHKKYPNATFVAKTSPLNWKDMISAEANSLGKSLVQITDSNHDGWKHINSYNVASNSYANTYPGGGATWYAASPELVAYYMDPRNFLNEVFIFMFESNAYNSNIQTEDGVKNLISGTFMDSTNQFYNTYILENGVSYSSAIMQAASESGISPYVLAARIKQELGMNGNTIISGTVPGYEGLYNYYNIGATGSADAAAIIANGLSYARSRGWSSRIAAIVGGAKIIGSSYKGTQYSQKWDVIDAPFYSMQYMQNIQAPANETVSVYDTYAASNSLQSAFVFEIPVFQNMPEKLSEMPNCNTTINYLSDIKINGASLSDFNTFIEEYTTYVPAGTTVIKLDASTKDSRSTITGLGNIELTGDETVVEIKVTAPSGNVRVYKVKVVKSKDIEISASEIVNQLGLKSDGAFISGFTNNITTDSIKSKINSISSTAIVKIVDKNGNEKTGTFVTGDKIIVTSGDDTVSHEVLVYGDLNGDGAITILDLLMTQKKLLGALTLNGVYERASDVDKDGSVTIRDLLIIQKYLLGTYNIEQ